MIYNQFIQIQQQVPDLCFYLLFILSSNQFDINIRFYSITILYRCQQTISIELLPKFIEVSIPILKQILFQQNSPFTKFAVSIICTQMKLVKNKKFLNVIIQIIQMLLTQMETIIPALEMIDEMCYSGFKVPDQFLEFLPNYLTTPHQYHVLTIINKIINTNTDYGLRLLPFIYSLSNQMAPPSLSQVAIISLKVFQKHNEDVIGSFLSSCIVCQYPSVSDYIVLEMFDCVSIPFSQPIILSLLQRLSVKNENEPAQYNICFLSQLILQNMCDIYGEKAESIVREFLPHCVNPGHTLRCLYTFLSIANDSERFLQFILDNISGPFRNDAAVCLVSYCFSVPSSITNVLSIIISMIDNSNEYITYALEELFQFEFEATNEHFLMLYKKVKETQTDEVIKYADLLNQYILHFPLQPENPILINFFNEILQCFLTNDSSHLLFSIFTEIISNILLIIIPPFGDFVLHILKHIQRITEDFIDDNTFYSCLCLCSSIFKQYGEFLRESIECKELLLSLTEYASDYRENRMIITKAFECIFNYAIKDQNILNDFGDLWVKSSLSYYSASNVEVSALIAKFWMNFIPKINIQMLRQFYIKTNIACKVHPNETEDIHVMKVFADLILKFFMENSIEIPLIEN